MPISLSKRIGPDSFSVVWGSLHLLHNEPVIFPALPVPIYTPESRGVIMVKCLTQGHNTLIVTGLEPTTFCLWTQHWSARPHAPTHIGQWVEIEAIALAICENNDFSIYWNEHDDVYWLYLNSSKYQFSKDVKVKVDQDATWHMNQTLMFFLFSVWFISALFSEWMK